MDLSLAKKIVLNIVATINKIALFLIGLVAVAFFLPLNILDVTAPYEEELIIANDVKCRLQFFVAVVVIVYLFARKFPKLKYVEMLLWAVLFVAVPYMLHQIPSVKQTYNNVTVSEDVKS